LKALLFIIILLTCLYAGKSHARNVDAMKAAYVYYYSQLLEWPDLKVGKTIEICFRTKEQSISDQFFNLNSQAKNNIHVIEITPGLGTEACDILYADSLSDHEDRPGLLLVGESQSTADIKFIIQKNKLSFEINNKKIQMKGLRASAKLLQLAARVHQ